LEITQIGEARCLKREELKFQRIQNRRDAPFGHSAPAILKLRSELVKFYALTLL
jgi:hypothetical protein